MKKFIHLVGCLFFLVFFECSVKPNPISYGTDICYNCKMTIVDRVHASEIVSKKGKVFKFDAIECMLRFMNNINLDDYALFLIHDLEAPGVLIDATEAHYLISPQIPSPMGGNLTGFSKKEKAEQYKIDKGGEVYTWESIQEKF